ncbi:hypothetical protein D9M69_672160 [compost metagenome]
MDTSASTSALAVSFIDGTEVLAFGAVDVIVASGDGVTTGVPDEYVPLTTKSVAINSTITPTSMIVPNDEELRTRLGRFASDMIPPGRWSVIERT